MWPFAGFLHPALAWGALLAAVPLIIHLLNRQRHKPLEWAAMRFVLEAYKRTKRRAQIENLLLLLLRMAAVAALALSIARPFTGEHSPLAPLTERRRDLVLVLDASASTAYRESVASVFERIVERARVLVGELDGASGDRVRLVRAAGVATTLGGRTPEEAQTLLATLTRPSDEPMDLAAAISAVAELAEEEAAGTEQSLVEVRLLTDLQRASFLPDPAALLAAASLPGEAEPAASASGAAERGNKAPLDSQGGDPGGAQSDPLQRALARLQTLGVRVLVEDLGPEARVPANLSVERVGALDESLTAGLTSDFGVSVRNHGEEGKVVNVALKVDGERLPSQRLDVPALSEATALFSLTFRTAGDHSVVALIDFDHLERDDTRALVVRVPEPLNVLLVDGDPRPDVDDDEVGLLRVILEPLDGDGPLRGATPFTTRVVTLSALEGGNALEEANAIVLANADALGPALVERLERQVAAGAALVVTAGDRMAHPSTLAAWNERLWRPDGSGLLPARLGSVVSTPDRRREYRRVASFDEEHPVLAFFADERWKPFLTEVPIYAFLRTDVAEGTGTQVLARLDDDEASPLLVTRDYDRGKVVLFTTSVDKAWARFAESPTSFVPLFHELLRWAGSGPPQPRNLSVGGTLAAEVTGFPREPMLVRPDGARRPLDGEPTAVTAEHWRLPPTPPADEAGLWRIEGNGFAPIPFAVTLDPEESDLARLDPSELEGISTTFRLFTPEVDGSGVEDVGPKRGELWRPLALVALLALCLETLWAAWIGRGRRRA